MNANDRQVDGTHYQAAIQHWDFVEVNGMGYLEGCATKYVARNRKKYASPLVDLEKALHYVEKLKALYIFGVRGNRVTHITISPDAFAAANGLTREEKRIVALLLLWKTEYELDLAIHSIKQLIEAARG